MPRTILLADDSVTAQNMGKKILSDAGYEVITVSNGSAALKKANELLPDIAVLDVYMPGYSGLEVCKQLKENARTAEIPILLTVGKLEPFKSEEALKAKANAFIIKPFEATELLNVIRKIEDATSKTAKKATKAPKASTLSKGFAKSSASVDEPLPDPGMQDTGIEEKGWKNRLVMPSKNKADPDPYPEEEAVPAMGTGFRDLTSPPAGEDSVRRESSFTAEAATSAGDTALDISPEEIAAIRAAVEVLSGEGDRAPVLQVGAVDGMPRQLAPEPEQGPEYFVEDAPVAVAATTEPKAEAPEELVAAKSAPESETQVTAAVEVSIPEPAPAPMPEPEPVATRIHWVAEAVEVTSAEASVSLEHEMQVALGIVSAAAPIAENQTEKFNTYSLADFADSAVANPVDDEPIVSEKLACEKAASEAAATNEPASAMAASATGDSRAVSNLTVPTGAGDNANVGDMQGASIAASEFQDLRPMASAAGAGVAEVAGGSAPVRDPSAPDDEIDSRTKSQMDAAWSNWREIRNTIVTPNLTEQLADIAAGVAAHSAEDELQQPTASAGPQGTGHDPIAIANIVDSVLAEMRPKLLEEITRKLAAKKSD